jgi:hypothetical protein
MLRIKIADSEKQSSGVAARIDSVKTLIPYSAFKIGNRGPIRISPALILDEIAKIGRPCLKVFFMRESYQPRSQNPRVLSLYFPLAIRKK